VEDLPLKDAERAKIPAMTGNWGTVLTELIPLALVIALSPLSIIPAVLVLHTPRAKPASLLYLVGWVLALAVLTAIFVEVSGLTGNLSSPPKWASYLRIVVGAALIVFGIIRWVNRKKSPHMPKWMTQLGNVTPVKAGIMGAALAVINPKVLFICAAAGLAIGTTGIGSPAVWLAVAYFVAIAASTVALPVLSYAVSGERLQEPLNRLKEFMEKHNAALVAGILIIIGLLVLYKGIHTL
jgi:threonine/homoserine/homoserine lactone efflux protein